MHRTKEQDEKHKGQACRRKEYHNGWEVLGIKIASLCEYDTQQALSKWEDSAWFDMWEGCVANMLEEAKVAV